jgi:hypothetical protein
LCKEPARAGSFLRKDVAGNVSAGGVDEPAGPETTERT